VMCYLWGAIYLVYVGKIINVRVIWLDGFSKVLTGGLYSVIDINIQLKKLWFTSP
jgi:hypothetical protein